MSMKRAFRGLYGWALPMSIMAALWAHAAANTSAPPPAVPGPRGTMFAMQNGQSIYEHVCKACHMPGAKGAVGAGAYPALARDPRLAVPGYVVAIIINGQKAMPSFGSYFNNSQIAEIANYIRTHFGNHYAGRVTTADVKAMR